jgi:pimeloyl-ACP methyl ester carboxylesterase
MITGDRAPMSLWMPYLLKPLARSFHVTIFDNRGVGYSTDDPRQRMSVPLMAADTVGLIKALGLRRPTVAGWSMGGEIGITMAERYPATLARLVTTGADAGSRHTIPPPPGLIKKLKNPDNVTAALQLLFPPSPAGQAAQMKVIQGYSAISQESICQTTLNRQASAENAFLKYPNVWDALGTIHTPDRGV